jgi:hypothetical protein
MAKNPKQRQYQAPTPPSLPVPSFPRLDGDDLFTWAQILERERHLAETKAIIAEQVLRARGFEPGAYLLSNDGYILSREQHEDMLRSSGRIRSFPVLAESDQDAHTPEAEPSAHPVLPGSAS